MARPGRETRRNRGGNRDHQRAGAADQQQRKAAIDPRLPRRAEGQRRHDRGEKRHAHNRGHVDAAEPVDEPLDRGARALGLLHEVQNARDRVVFGGFLDADAQLTLGVDRSGEDRVAGLFQDRHALARHRAFIDARTAGDDVAIGGDAVTRAGLHDLADGEAVGGNLANAVADNQPRGLRHQIGQRPDRTAGARRRKPFEHLAHREQEDHERRFLRRTDEERADRCDAHQHFDCEGHPRPCHQGGALGHRGNCDHGREHEGPMRDRPADQQLDHPCRSQQKPGRDQVTALRGRIP